MNGRRLLVVTPERMVDLTDATIGPFNKSNRFLKKRLDLREKVYSLVFS